MKPRQEGHPEQHDHRKQKDEQQKQELATDHLEDSDRAPCVNRCLKNPCRKLWRKVVERIEEGAKASEVLRHPARVQELLKSAVNDPENFALCLEESVGIRIQVGERDPIEESSRAERRSEDGPGPAPARTEVDHLALSAHHQRLLDLWQEPRCMVANQDLKRSHRRVSQRRRYPSVVEKLDGLNALHACILSAMSPCPKPPRRVPAEAAR